MARMLLVLPLQVLRAAAAHLAPRDRPLRNSKSSLSATMAMTKEEVEAYLQVPAPMDRPACLL